MKTVMCGKRKHHNCSMLQLYPLCFCNNDKEIRQNKIEIIVIFVHDFLISPVSFSNLI